MKKNKRNIDKQVEDIIRYLEDKMTVEERNAFERKLQSDPFLAEAVEGYSLIDPDEVGTDMEDLKERIKSRTRKKSTFLYRIAAAIVVLLGISSLFLVKNLRQPDLKMAESREISRETSPVTPMIDPSEAKPEIPDDIALGKQELKELPDRKSIAEFYGIVEDTLVEDEYMLAGDLVPKEAKAETLADAVVEEIPGKAKEVEATGRIAGVAARPETMRKAARVHEVAAKQMAAFDISRKAQPVIGEDEYLRYLEDKQVYPAGYGDTTRLTVSLEMIIEEDGTLGQIKIKESPAKVFSDEAVRLVKEGPAWLPALKDGEAVRDTVDLAIVFK
ncbi:MAG: energy transducer TonB [Bacteroidota bacterium]|nr:energy transducer TonB [Bacteroidota bacterium]